jgi:hypothetical protein
MTMNQQDTVVMKAPSSADDTSLCNSDIFRLQWIGYGQ